jgi:hypothetical protein
MPDTPQQPPRRRYRDILKERLAADPDPDATDAAPLTDHLRALDQHIAALRHKQRGIDNLLPSPAPCDILRS